MKIKIEPPDVVDEALKPVGKETGELLSLLFNTVFAIPTYVLQFPSLWIEKKKIEYNKNLEIYTIMAQNEIAKIKSENFQEPKYNIVAPAIEKSKYYFEEEHYREMFAKLIASSCDKSCNDKIHPSFIEIITQLSANDAIFLKELSKKDDMTIPCMSLDVKKDFPFTSPITETFLLGQNTIGQCNEDLIVLDNLQRLKLIDVLFATEYSDKNIYEPFKEHFIYKEEMNKNKDKLVEKRGIIKITEYGRAFVNVCVSNNN